MKLGNHHAHRPPVHKVNRYLDLKRLDLNISKDFETIVKQTKILLSSVFTCIFLKVDVKILTVIS